MNWVTIGKFAEMTGYSEDAVRHKIKNGTWLKADVWKHAPDSRVLISVEGYERWVESHSRESNRGAKPRSKSPSTTAASGAERRLHSRQPQPIKSTADD